MALRRKGYWPCSCMMVTGNGAVHAVPRPARCAKEKRPPRWRAAVKRGGVEAGYFLMAIQTSCCVPSASVAISFHVPALRPFVLRL